MGTQTGDDPIGDAQLRRRLAAAIEDEQLMPDQYGFRNNGADPALFRANISDRVVRQQLAIFVDAFGDSVDQAPPQF
jgi:hypothetical protein